ncbi:10852_t:CDS:2 [Funneliformis geosporum]|uniref:18161_t:CDS:1 n=1 Tax=Funneliformis geosporum TaxID=1117311 RepID=A0A9W4SC26_9GLOM|nr:10852_t:CDS:2 [Funneliformis geosporum]CAI2163392.1 18161_t:CDS:2 [Funneliformis geosporum]
MPSQDIRVVVAIDFGTTYSGFAYAHVVKPETIINDVWPRHIGQIKTNTVLQYDDKFQNVESWGFAALAKKPKRKEKNSSTKPVELFKLHLGDMPQSEKPYLPPNLDYLKAITDFFEAMETVTTRWPGLDFMTQVLFVLSVPAEFSEESKRIMRNCVYNANLISRRYSSRLQFTTEPEAAALYCMEVISENFDEFIEKTFLIVDCGGGTVDLTTRKLLSKSELGEVTVRSGDFCGGNYVDQEFINFLKTKVGTSAIDLLKENLYGQYQYLVHEFCKNVKFPFTGNIEEFETYELDIEQICPAMIQYITGPERDTMKDMEWIIEIDFEDVKNMFDKVIARIIGLIRGQLYGDKSCSTIFLVGGFSESKYLQRRIKQEFQGVKHISVPRQPIAAVMRGAVKYGINRGHIKNRVLKYNYGMNGLRTCEARDPANKMRLSGLVLYFKILAKKGTVMGLNETFSESCMPENSDQATMRFQILISKDDDVKYCEEESVKKLGEFVVELPNTHLEKPKQVDFELCFAEMEIKAYARNKYNNTEYNITCDLEF